MNDRLNESFEGSPHMGARREDHSPSENPEDVLRRLAGITGYSRLHKAEFEEALSVLVRELKAARLTIESQATVLANYTKAHVALEAENAAMKQRLTNWMEAAEQEKAENDALRRTLEDVPDMTDEYARMSRVVDAARALFDSGDEGEYDSELVVNALREALDSLDKTEGDTE